MIVKRIQHSYSEGSRAPFFSEKEGKKIKLEFGDEHAQLRRRLVQDWRLLTLDYQVFRARMVNLNNDKTLVNHVQDALEVVRMLEVVYRDYLVVPTEARRYRAEIEEYEQWLLFNNNNLSLAENSESYSTQVRGWTVFLNFPRLLTMRSRRTVIALRPFTEGVFTQFIRDFEDSTRWFASYQAWIFFVPRLLTNLIFFCKHVIENPLMNKPERDLGWETRFIAQLDRRWIELSNDITWFTSGAIACFLLTGTWGFFGVYLNAVTQFMDVVFAIIRISNERRRYLELENSYKGLFTDEMSDYKAEISVHLRALSGRLDHERKLLWLALVNPTVLLVAACMLCFTANPILPFLGGMLSIAMTIANFLTGRYLRRQIPQDGASQFLLNNPRPKDPRPPIISSKSEGCVLKLRVIDDEVADYDVGERQNTPINRSASAFEANN